MCSWITAWQTVAVLWVTSAVQSNFIRTRHNRALPMSSEPTSTCCGQTVISPQLYHSDSHTTEALTLRVGWTASLHIKSRRPSGTAKCRKWPTMYQRVKVQRHREIGKGLWEEVSKCVRESECCWVEGDGGWTSRKVCLPWQHKMWGDCQWSSIWTRETWRKHREGWTKCWMLAS